MFDGVRRVAREASANAADQTISEAGVPSDQGDSGEIEDEWLLSFRREVGDRGVGEMRETFCRILAGEIQRPGTFCIRTLRTVGTLSQKTAALFRKAVSVSIRLELLGMGGEIIDARIPAVSGQLAQNSLASEGLAYDQLIHLTETGLLHSDYGSWYPYNRVYVVPHPRGEGNVVRIPMIHQDEEWALVPKPDGPKTPKDKRVSGAAFTSVGKELLRIVDIEPNPNFRQKLISYFETRKLDMVKINQAPPESMV